MSPAFRTGGQTILNVSASISSLISVAVFKGGKTLFIATWRPVVVAALLFVSASVVQTPALAGPIHDAAKAGDAVQVERLIEAGADVNEMDAAFKTALHWATDEGHMDVVQLLVEKGANVNAKDFTDLTPLFLAVLRENESILEFLIAKGADVNSAETDGVTALDNAIRRNYAGVVEILKRAEAKRGTNEQYSRDCNLAAGSE